MRRPIRQFALALGAALSVACSVGLPERPDTPDAGATTDAAVVTDSGPPLACPPGSLAGFAPTATWRDPNPVHRALCTEQQAQAIAECIANDANPTACDPIAAALPACFGCAVTSALAPTLGPFIKDGSFYVPNPSGCVAALTGDMGPTGCGARYRANRACADYACQACVNQPNANGYFACMEAASSGACASYDISCAKPVLLQCDNPALPSYSEYALGLIRLFCLP